MGAYEALARTVLNGENILAEDIKGKTCLVIGDAGYKPDGKCCTELVTEYLLSNGAVSCAVLGNRFDPLQQQETPDNVEFKLGHLTDLADCYGQQRFDVVILMEGLEKCRDLYGIVRQLALNVAGGRLYVITRTPQELSAGNGGSIYWYEDIWRFEPGDMGGLFPQGKINKMVSLALNLDDNMRWVFTDISIPSQVSPPHPYTVYYSCAANKRISLSQIDKTGYFPESELEAIGARTETDKAFLQHNYLDKYDFLLAPMRDKGFTLLELGVFLGASERMWQEYFPYAQIIGVDINENCRMHEDERINILIRDLGDEAVLQELAELHPRIIVDDASHLWSHQVKAFFTLFPSLPSGGIYIMEDLETSLSMNLPGLKNDYADYPIDAYTICERVMRVVASKVPDSTPDEYAANVTDIGMAVEMGVTIKGSCVFIKR